MIKHTKKDLKFIAHVKEVCKLHNIYCDLRPTKTVRYSPGIRCSGWFDSVGRKLVVAMNDPGSLGVLAHEYCHLTQWLDEHPLWDQAGESLWIIDEWLADKSDTEDIGYHLGIARDLELDNEKRTAVIIEHWGLSIDLDDYIQKANAYVLFYNYMFYIRRWSASGNSPYRNKYILKHMSRNFDMCYDHLTHDNFKVFLNARIGIKIPSQSKYA